MYFPIILYPKPIEEFLKSVDASKRQLPPKPLAPTLITQNAIPRRNTPRTPMLNLALIATSILVVVTIIAKFSFWLLIPLLLSCGCTLILQARNFALGQFYQKLIQDENQIREYKESLKAYKKAQSVWIKAQQQYNKNVEAYRRELYEQLERSLLVPQGYTQAQQGAAEARFKGYLDRYFPNCIHQGFKLPIPKSSLDYSADFAYVDKSFRLYIDIEIDEPYYYKTKKPTHCCDDDKDKIRNAFFLKNNWIVIRFAEEQIVRYPNRCCQVIAKVVAEITGEWQVFDKFKDVPSLPTVKHWTTSKARKMAKANYRNRYLK